MLKFKPNQKVKLLQPISDDLEYYIETYNRDMAPTYSKELMLNSIFILLSCIEDETNCWQVYLGEDRPQFYDYEMNLIYELF